jgi:hypothetical protein
MPQRLQDNQDDFDALVSYASDALGIQQSFVVKDFWVTEVLRTIAEPLNEFCVSSDASPYIVFKGGTSLSRALKLTHRFSEDIDILVAPDTLEVGSKPLQKLMDKIDKRARPAVLGSGLKATVAGGKFGFYKNIEYPYRGSDSAGSLKPYVYLEIGVRGTPQPSAKRTIRSLLAEATIEATRAKPTDFAEFEPFELLVLQPHRTLVEKLAALHTAGQLVGTDRDDMITKGRHLYDIHALLTTDEVVAPFKQEPTLMQTMAEDCHSISNIYGWDSSERPAQGFASSQVFIDGSPACEALRAAYGQVGSLLYGGPKPTFEQCLEAIQGNAPLL